MERCAKGELHLPAVLAERLIAYDWPGNVRELENCMEHAVAMARFNHLSVDDLPPQVSGPRSGCLRFLSNEPVEFEPLGELERRHIVRVMSLLGGNRFRAAHALGLDRRTLHRRLAGYSTAESAER